MKDSGQYLRGLLPKRLCDGTRERDITQATSEYCMRACPSGIPPELCCIVIDHLHANKSSLKSCSLVHRSWTPHSQRHLFACITVSAKLHSRAAILFSPFLSAQPDIASHITMLVIEHEDCLSFSTLRSIIISLPKISNLKLRSCLIIGRDPLPDQLAQPRQLSQVHPMKVVDLAYCCLPEDTLYQILGLFTHIGQLSLARITLLNPRHYRAHIPILPALTIHSLDVAAIPVAITASLLSHSAIVKTMESLSLSQPASLCPLHAIDLLPNPFMLGLLCSLFDIPYHDDVRPGNIFEQLPMGDCKMLRLLTHWLVCTDPADMHSSIRVYLGSLSYLPASVQEVRFILCLHVDLDKPDVDGSLWDEVDAMILDGPQDIRVVLDARGSSAPHTDEDIDELEEFLEDRLPGACEQGRFTVAR